MKISKANVTVTHRTQGMGKSVVEVTAIETVTVTTPGVGGILGRDITEIGRRTLTEAVPGIGM